MESSSLCTDIGSAACTLLNCLDDLILLAACYVSLIIFFVPYSNRWRYQYRLFGFEIVSARDGDALRTGEFRQYVPKISPRVVILETIGLLGELITSIALLVHGQDCPLAFASILYSAYLFLLLGGRVYGGELDLQLHSASLYFLRWLFAAVSTSTLFFGKPGLFNLVAILMRLAIFTTLCLVHGTAARVQTQISHGGDEQSSEPGKEETASLISRLTFFWMTEIVWKAFRKPLEAHDLYQLNRSYTASAIALGFGRTAAVTAPLLWRIFNFFKFSFFVQGAWAFITSILVIIRPLLIRRILQYLENQNRISPTTTWLCVIGLLLSGLLASTADCQANWIWRKISVKTRSVLLNEIYAKVLRKGIAKPFQAQYKSNPVKETEIETETSKDGEASDGNLLNLISADVEVVADISGGLYLLWITFPVQMVLGTYLLYQILGTAGIIGVIVMMALLPLNLWLSKKLMNVQGQVLAASDARIQASNEVLNNIRTIKYNAWELPFRDRVLDRRGTELRRMRSRFIWWSISMTLFYLLPVVMTVFTCLFYTIVWDKELGTDVAFPALATFAVLRVPINRAADSVTFYLQAYVSFKRISKFLAERDTYKYLQLSRSDSPFVGFKDATLTWPTNRSNDLSDEGSIEMTSTPTAFRLQNIRVEFQKDALNIVCGPSGSGKSSLLLALLGEMDLVRGRVCLPYTESGVTLHGLQNSPDRLLQPTAYCPQEPWIMNQSIRANILFGLPFDTSRYEKVLHAVALLPDLSALDQGDRTVTGENGNRLSGGQKQRVALARALYSYSKYILLDDCFSAVDSRTAQHIFFHAIIGPLMRGRTCILATHNTQLTVPHCKHAIILDKGQVSAQGTGEELVAAGLLGTEILEVKEKPRNSWDDILIEPSKLSSSCDSLSSRSSSRRKEKQPLNNVVKMVKSNLKLKDENSKHEQHTSNYGESKSEGSISWSVVQFWLGSMGHGWFWIIVLVGFGIQQVTGLGLTLWIKQWSYQYDHLKAELSLDRGGSSHKTIKPEKVLDWYYLTVYFLIGCSYAVITFLRDMIVFYGSLKASRQIYERLLDSVLYAKLLFFDRVPLGQITNRFSKDVGVLDQSLVAFSIGAFQITGYLITVVLLISVYLPAFLVAATIIFLCYYCVGTVFIHGARDFKRIEAVERSPLYQQFGETIAGSASIRAYARTSVFAAQNYNLVDRINTPYLLQWASKEWLTFCIGFFSSLILFSTGAFVMWKKDSISSGAAGLVLTYAATFTDNMLWLVQLYAFVQQDLNSVERIVEYFGVELEDSRPLKRSAEKVSADWPSHGLVRFDNYTTSYAPELKPALQGVNFVAAAGERVAIVGRTGAGKSTFALALIRVLEAGGGRIEIDGIDIASVSLKQLRKAVTIVPQDPKVFGGTLRDNLSPVSFSNEGQMLAVLRAVRILGSNTDPNSIMYSDLDRPADTLSRGQRQLLCIARGLLQCSSVFMLDEATASVDHATDVAVQASLRASIPACTTVFTIAHRLSTIADYDRVIVLEAGHIVELGSPKDLLSHHGEKARFRRMCEDSGDLEEIKKAAGII